MVDQSASRAAEALINAGGAGGDGESAEVKELKEKMAKMEKELSSANKNVESMKTQSENLTTEYDRSDVLLLYSTLKKKII